MTNWQKSTTRQAPKTKAELREMLTEAVRNTQPALEPASRRHNRDIMRQLAQSKQAARLQNEPSVDLESSA